MSTRVLCLHTLVCDGCGAVFGREPGFGSTIEARAAAYSAGWRFPEKVRVSSGPSRTVNDVCQECVPTFQPSLATNPHEGRRRRD